MSCEISVKKLHPKFRDEIAKAFTTLQDKYDFTNCLSCGMCTAGCPYSDVHKDFDPRKFVRMCNMGMKEEILADEFVWKCNMCARCTMLCPMNVDVSGMVRTIRGNFGLPATGFLKDIVQAQLKTGNQMEITQEDYVDTLEWMAEELQEEIDDPTAQVPVDKEGAEFLFLWDPREIKYYPQDIQSIAKIMHAAKADWTCSSRYWDATHYALFDGNDEAAKVMVQRIADEVKRLKVKYVVITECGHATRAQKWGKDVWLNAEDANYPVYNLVQKQAEWIREGRIKLDPTKNPDKVTLHDPCNLVRKEGVVEELRYCVNNACMDFVEMHPNRRFNYCCGAGGGLLALGKPMAEHRMDKGNLKAEQIKNTGAKILVTPCHNCYDQLREIIKHHKLDVKLNHIHHMVSNALILDK